jgi:dimethyladenosine transferase (EC 2.1.1.-)
MRFLEEKVPLKTMVIMIQKEVANRINAVPSTKDYGSLSVAVQYYCDTDIVAKAPKGAFIPEPGVDSAVIKLEVKEDKGIELIDEDLFFEVVKAAFSKRRKTLLNALSTFGRIGGKQEAKMALEIANIDAQLRGETLDMKQFASLANAYAKVLNK